MPKSTAADDGRPGIWNGFSRVVSPVILIPHESHFAMRPALEKNDRDFQRYLNVIKSTSQARSSGFGIPVLTPLSLRIPVSVHFLIIA